MHIPTKVLLLATDMTALVCRTVDPTTGAFGAGSRFGSSQKQDVEIQTTEQF